MMFYAKPRIQRISEKYDGAPPPDSHGTVIAASAGRRSQMPSRPLARFLRVFKDFSIVSIFVRFCILFSKACFCIIIISC